MKQPVWRILLSYFIDVPLEKAGSDLNPFLDLSLRKGRYCLTTPNAIYSYSDLYDNFTETFKRLDLDEMAIREVLILGFGLGSIPYMLEKVFVKKYHYVGVEQDEVIVRWAERYMLPELQSSIDIEQADARSFVKNCKNKFDLVIVDIFLDDQVPPIFEEIDFLLDLKGLLNERGMLLYNRLTAQARERMLTEEFYQKTFKTVFPGAAYFDLHGNRMLKNY